MVAAGRCGCDGDVHRTLTRYCPVADGAEADQISPTSWNLASTISLSNGFMMYSLAPACSARAIWATSFSVVQNTTFGASPPGNSPQRAQELVAVHLRHVPVEQDRLRQLAPAGVERLLAVLGLHDLEFEPFENSPRHLADDAGVVNDQTGFHCTASSCLMRAAFRKSFNIRFYVMPRSRFAADVENAVDIEHDRVTVRPSRGCRPTRAPAADRD